MKLSELGKDILTKGAILGVLMMFSRIVEDAMFIYGNSMGWMQAYSAELLLSAVLYVWLVYRFTKSYSLKYMEAQRSVKFFTYFNGLAYVVYVSMLAGVLAGVGGYLFRHYVVGFDAYVDGTVNLLKTAAADLRTLGMGGDIVDQTILQVSGQAEPSLLATVVNYVSNYMMGGMVLGLVIGGIVKRDPQIFDRSEDENRPENE